MGYIATVCIEIVKRRIFFGGRGEKRERGGVRREMPRLVGGLDFCYGSTQIEWEKKKKNFDM